MRTLRPSKLIICKSVFFFFFFLVVCVWWSYNKNNSLVTIYFKFWSNKIKLRHIILSLRIFQIFCIFVKPKNLVQQPSLWLVSSNITTHQFIVWLKPTLHKWLDQKIHTKKKKKTFFLRPKISQMFQYNINLKYFRAHTPLTMEWKWKGRGRKLFFFFLNLVSFSLLICK